LKANSDGFQQNFGIPVNSCGIHRNSRIPADSGGICGGIKSIVVFTRKWSFVAFDKVHKY